MKKWTCIKYIVIMIIGFSPMISMAQQDTVATIVHQFSIQQAVNYAEKNNVQVKNALLDVKLQEQVNREVTGSAYPQINGSGSLVYNAKLPISLVPAEFFGGPPGTFQPLAFGVKWGATGGINLNQILFDGLVFVGLLARSTLIDFRLKNVEVTAELIRTNVYKVYYQLVVSKTQLELLDTNIALIRKLQRDTKIMYDNGFAAQIEVDRATVQLANLQTEKINVLNQVANGYLGLKVLMGMPVRDSLALTDSISDEGIKDGMLDASQFTYAQRRDYQYADLGVRLDAYNVRRYKLSKIPTLSLNGYYNKNAQRNSFDFLKSNGNWFDISAFTLNLNIPIFNGFATNSRIQQAKITMQKDMNLRENLKLVIDQEIFTAKNNFTAAIAALDYQRKNMELAENVFTQTKKQFEIGTGDQIAVNQAQTDLKAAQTNYINALYSAVIARVDFLKATGKL